MAAPAQAAAPAVAPAGAGLSAVPDSNTLLAYKLLQDSWTDGNVFEDLLHDEMKYLVAGISLLNNDPYLAMKMGGVTLNAAGQLAGIIKAKENELDLSARIDPVAKTILTHKFAKPDMLEMMPGRRKPVTITTNNNGRASMSFKAGKFANTGIAMGAPANARSLIDMGLQNAGGMAGGAVGRANISVGNGIQYG